MTELSVKRVVVMEDRAQVERRGTVTLNGVTRVEVTGLPLVVVDRSLRVEAKGGSVLDARIERRHRKLPPGGLPADATELRRRVKSLEHDTERCTDEVNRASGRTTLLEAARDDLFRAIREQSGIGVAETSKWSEQLRQLSEQQTIGTELLRKAHEQLEASQRSLSEARRALDATERPLEVRECILVLTLQGNGEAEIAATYLVPCAVWRPAYRATLAGSEVTIEAAAMVWQNTGEDWKDVALQVSTARPTLGTTPPQLAEDILELRPKQAMERRTVNVSIREEAIQTSGEGGGVPELPGVDDGGEVRLLSAATPVSITSNGLPHRIELFQFTSAATTEHLCPAELSSLAFVLARFENRSPHALLAGPVELVRSAGVVGRGQLRFAAPKEMVKLSFGSEDGLQIHRSSEEKTEEARITGRRTTTRRITLHVSNMRPVSTRLIIEERLPTSEVKEIEIQVIKKECRPAPSTVSEEGIARLELELAAHSTATAQFAWELSAAASVSGL